MERVFASVIWGAYFREGLCFFFPGGGVGAYYLNYTLFKCFHTEKYAVQSQF